MAQPGQKAGKPYFTYSKLTLCQSTVLKKREQQTHLCCRCSSAWDEGEVETPSGGRRGFKGIPHIISSDMEDLTKLPVYKLLNQSAVKRWALPTISFKQVFADIHASPKSIQHRTIDIISVLCKRQMTWKQLFQFPSLQAHWYPNAQTLNIALLHTLARSFRV